MFSSQDGDGCHTPVSINLKQCQSCNSKSIVSALILVNSNLITKLIELVCVVIKINQTNLAVCWVCHRQLLKQLIHLKAFSN